MTTDPPHTSAWVPSHLGRYSISSPIFLFLISVCRISSSGMAYPSQLSQIYQEHEVCLFVFGAVIWVLSLIHGGSCRLPSISPVYCLIEVGACVCVCVWHGRRSSLRFIYRLIYACLAPPIYEDFVFLLPPVHAIGNQPDLPACSRSALYTWTYGRRSFVHEIETQTPCIDYVDHDGGSVISPTEYNMGDYFLAWTRNAAFSFGKIWRKSRSIEFL